MLLCFSGWWKFYFDVIVVELWWNKNAVNLNAVVRFALTIWNMLHILQVRMRKNHCYLHCNCSCVCVFVCKYTLYKQIHADWSEANIQHSFNKWLLCYVGKIWILVSPQSPSVFIYTVYVTHTYIHTSAIAVAVKMIFLSQFPLVCIVLFQNVRAEHTKAFIFAALLFHRGSITITSYRISNILKNKLSPNIKKLNTDKVNKHWSEFIH